MEIYRCPNCGNQKRGDGIYQCGRGHVFCSGCSTHSVQEAGKDAAFHAATGGILLAASAIFGGGAGKAIGDIGRTCPCGAKANFKTYIR